MPHLENLKHVRVLSETLGKPTQSSFDRNEIGQIYRIEDLKYFVGVEKVIVTATEILVAEAEWVSHIFSLSLSHRARVEIVYDNQTSDLENRNLVLFKMLRVHNLKLLTSEGEKLVLEYIGKTILPSIVPKPKKYLIADVMWEILVKIAPLRIGAKYTYRFFLKLKERLH